MYDGGFYLERGGLVRAGLNIHSASLDNPFSEETLTAINNLQNTPWRINRAVLEIMHPAYFGGLVIGDMPPPDNPSEPPRLPDDLWESMPRDERDAYKIKRSHYYTEIAMLEGRRFAWLSKLDMATDVADEPAIWFPHSVDFRGRLYPLISDLSPQGDDAGKALLMFALGKPLGEEGMFWLCVRAANCYTQDGDLSLDKLPMRERVEWTVRNRDRIVEAAAHPLDGSQWWTQAEEPWSFLATCFELTQAFDDQENFVSHLPVPLDGSCNGLQHLAAMGRDRVGGMVTNVVPGEVRRDIYSEVATIINHRVSQDAAAGNPQAVQWLGKVGRKTVKRAVMTTPYGVTDRGIRDQLINDKHTHGMDKRGEAADYLRDCIVDALAETSLTAKQIMSWLQEIAGRLADHDIPFRWQTPTGNTVQQSYWDLTGIRVETLAGRITLEKETPESGLRKRKQRLAAAPNVIHSFDAAHCCRTINACVAIGITNFAMIHDSFGTHATDTGFLSHVLREEFARIYADNWLQRIEDYVRSYAGDIELPSWKEYVTLGDLDVSQVVHAAFFFA